MKHELLFLHGGGEGAYAADEPLVASLRDALGAAYDVRYPSMPTVDQSVYEEWKAQLGDELAAMSGALLLVGHSFGASMLLKFGADVQPTQPIAGLFLVACPY